MAGPRVIDPLAAVGRVLDLPLHLVDEPAGMVDDWGRDAALVRNIIGLAQLRWHVSVGGDQHLPRRKGALIVVNARRYALAPIFAALAISEAVDRPVRFVGRSDSAPLGPLARRIGGLLDHPDELFGALRAGELVVMGAGATMGARDVGRIRHDLVGAATAAGVQVYPAATSSTPFGRSARVEIGQATRPSLRRRGPLAELELADHLRSRIASLLAEMGDIRTGTPLDWLPLTGIGGAR
ncbi:MAG: hypothetical protein ABWZ99_14695 [Ilumatobacteraceae bacterium]